MNHDTAPEHETSGHDDRSEPTTDDRVRTATQLSGFQRDILTILAREGETYGLGIKSELEDWYGDVNHGRLYPNLDELVDDGFVEKYALDDRTNGYRLTGRGQRVLYAYAEHLFQATADTDFRSAAELRTDGAGLDEYDSLADAEMDGVYPCRACGRQFDSEERRDEHVCGRPVLADGGEVEVKPSEPDETLRLTDDGIEMPDMLRGYVGKFWLRTADITGEYTTTSHGLPDTDFYDGVIAVYPDDDGSYNPYLRAGLLSLETQDHPERVFEIVDERSDNGGAE